MDHPASWRNPRILSTLLLVFLAGGVAGALTLKTAVWYRAHYRPQIASRPPVPGPILPENTDTAKSVGKLQTELNLTPAQVQTLETTLDDYHKYLQQLEQQVLELQRQILDTKSHGKENIRKILTPEQREKYDRLSHDLKKSKK